MKKSKVLSTILTILMVIECFLIIVTIGVFCSELSYGYSWYANENDMIFSVEQEEYGRLVKNYYTNELSGQKANNEMQECYGVAKYFEACFWYKAYDNEGDSVKASIYKEKMEDAYGEMGDYQFLDEKIRQKLNME